MPTPPRPGPSTHVPATRSRSRRHRPPYLMQVSEEGLGLGG